MTDGASHDSRNNLSTNGRRAAGQRDSAGPSAAGSPDGDSLLERLAALDTPVEPAEGGADAPSPEMAEEMVSDWSRPGSSPGPPELDDRGWLGRSLGTGGRYRVQSLLGRGGMGDIYLATDRHRNDTRVAIKVPCRRLLHETPSIRERFIREFAALIELEHPHICRITDTGTCDGVPFMVLQYLGGGNLKQRYFAAAINDEPRSIGRLFPWLRPIATALDFVHARGYLHRDVKPENILFDEHGNAYLSDFGIVRVLNQASSPADPDRRLTRFERWVGTPGYIAPEIGTGRDVDGRADLYALAAVVYYYLTGRPPYTGKDPDELRRAQLSEPPALAHEFNAQVPSAASDVLARALSVDPADRPDDCFAFATELERACTGSRESDRELAALVGARRRIPWLPVTLAAAVVILLTVSTALWSGWPGGTPPATGAAAPDEQVGSPVAGNDEVPVADAPEADETVLAADRAELEDEPPPPVPVEPNPLAEQLCRDAEKYLEYGEADDALQAVNRAIEIDGTRAHYYALRARACSALNLADHAVDQLTRAIEISPDAELYAERGCIRLTNNDAQNALGDFAIAIERDGTEPRYHFLRGLAWLTLDEAEQAADEYTRAIDAATPGVPAEELALWHNQRGMAYLKLEQLDHAISDATRAIELQSNEPAHYRNRAAALRRRGLAGDERAAAADENEADRLTRAAG